MPLIGLWLLALLLAVLIDAAPLHPKPIDELRAGAGPKDT